MLYDKKTINSSETYLCMEIRDKVLTETIDTPHYE